MPNIGTLYEGVLRGECNLPERDDQTGRAQRDCEGPAGFDRQLPNGWLAHWMKLHHNARRPIDNRPAGFANLPHIVAISWVFPLCPPKHLLRSLMAMESDRRS